ncbi:hypothetical protein M6G53_20460 [Serratia nevei]|uniref:hypothetical protein n=1 Tax=Serratia nevei TaxID=2703794 RepID=UPI0020A06F33|nr:hypothetical protein [Serratia nevei]MCP1107747.1 hypothetical protein [Serratia nevei]
MPKNPSGKEVIILAIYNFIAGHLSRNSDATLTGVYTGAKCAFENLDRRIDRFGNKRGGIVGFSEKNFSKLLDDVEVSSIGLFSEKILPVEDCEEEFMNCDFAISYSLDLGLLLSASDEVASIQKLLEISFECDALLDGIEYIYGYRETQRFGTGFPSGTHVIDDEHPFLWAGGRQLENWARIVRASKEDGFIRDVFDVNLFSDRKISSLPAKKRKILIDAIERFGCHQYLNSFLKWDVVGKEQEQARLHLIEQEVLGAYIN